MWWGQKRSSLLERKEVSFNQISSGSNTTGADSPKNEKAPSTDSYNLSRVPRGWKRPVLFGEVGLFGRPKIKHYYVWFSVKCHSLLRKRLMIEAKLKGKDWWRKRLWIEVSEISSLNWRAYFILVDSLIYFKDFVADILINHDLYHKKEDIQKYFFYSRFRCRFFCVWVEEAMPFFYCLRVTLF